MTPTNQYGVPLHACYGYRHDAHYWAWVRAVLVPRYGLSLTGA